MIYNRSNSDTNSKLDYDQVSLAKTQLDWLNLN